MARKSRQLVLMGPDKGGQAQPLGPIREVRATLARFNTAGDGTPPGVLERLFGPGMVVELPTGQDVVNQAIVTTNDEDTSFPVLMRLCKTLGWRMMDMESGRTIG